MDNNNLQHPPDANRKGDDLKAHFSWKDIFAFCIAIYRILIPQLLITLLVVIAFIYLLIWVWFN